MRANDARCYRWVTARGVLSHGAHNAAGRTAEPFTTRVVAE
jgi:hypothetical protein